MNGDDLAPLLVAQTQPGLGFRQGVVLTWDQQTAANAIEVAGATLTNVPILNTNEALLLEPGAVVGLLTAGSTWFLLGRITLPSTPAAASALSMVSSRIVSAEVSGQGTRSSSDFGDLTGTSPGPSVTATIGSSGKALVVVGATISTGGGTYTGGLMGYDISGATTRAASVADSLEASMSTVSFSVSASRTILVTGLNVGEHTFIARYASVANAVSFTAENRNIVVFAL